MGNKGATTNNNKAQSSSIIVFFYDQLLVLPMVKFSSWVSPHGPTMCPSFTALTAY